MPRSPRPLAAALLALVLSSCGVADSQAPAATTATAIPATAAPTAVAAATPTSAATPTLTAAPSAVIPTAIVFPTETPGGEQSEAGPFPQARALFPGMRRGDDWGNLFQLDALESYDLTYSAVVTFTDKLSTTSGFSQTYHQAKVRPDGTYLIKSRYTGRQPLEIAQVPRNIYNLALMKGGKIYRKYGDEYDCDEYELQTDVELGGGQELGPDENPFNNNIPGGFLGNVGEAEEVGRGELINGVRTVHYRVGQIEVPFWINIDIVGVPAGSGEAWVAEDTGILVKYSVDAIVTAEQLAPFSHEPPILPTTMHWEYSVGQINQPVTVVAPTGCVVTPYEAEPTPEDSEPTDEPAPSDSDPAATPAP